jgi:uncharacterized membrane protein YgaE (UPF0421/DUF939 family)
MLRLVPLGLLLLVSVPVHAEEPDLEQTITDLGSQASDKERLDAFGAGKVEISQIRGWLTDATNAVKRNAVKTARQCFELVRAQMKLVDQLVAVAQAEHEAARLDKEIAAAKSRIGHLTARLAEKRSQLRAVKLREGER